MIKNLVRQIGNKTLEFFQACGQLSRLFANILAFSPKILRNKRLLFNQMEHIGVNSLPLVIIIAVFTGAVAAW